MSDDTARRMRVLMVGYEYPPLGGGAGRSMAHLLREGRPCGVDYDCVTVHPYEGLLAEPMTGYDDPRILYKIGIQKASQSLWTKREVLSWAVRARWIVWQLLRQKHYDLVHIWSGLPSGLAVGASPPRVISLRGSDVPGFSGRLSLDYRLMAPYLRRLWRSGRVVANSMGLRDLALRFEKIPIDVIPNGVDAELFSYRVHRLHSPIRLLFCGRLIPRKRVPLLAEAVRALQQAGHPVVLRVVGDGPSREEYQARYPEVEWLQTTHEAMPQHYHWADFYVSASEHEGMSLSVLEALACGCPVVAVRHEGLESLPAAWKTDDSPADIAAAIIALAQHYDRQNPVVHALAPISWRGVMTQYRAVYEEVTGIRADEPSLRARFNLEIPAPRSPLDGVPEPSCAER